jgi:hypothetical protein
MGTRDKIAFVIYFVGSLVLITFGIVYLSCSTIMPYHQEAINMNWEKLSTGLQFLLQGLIKMAAAGFFVTGLSTLILLFFPFKKGAQWAHWAIPLLGIVWNGFSLYITATIAIKTHASTPWLAALVGIIFIIVAFVLSPGFGKSYLAESKTISKQQS